MKKTVLIIAIILNCISIFGAHGYTLRKISFKGPIGFTSDYYYAERIPDYMHNGPNGKNCIKGESYNGGSNGLGWNATDKDLFYLYNRRTGQNDAAVCNYLDANGKETVDRYNIPSGYLYFSDSSGPSITDDLAGYIWFEGDLECGQDNGLLAVCTKSGWKFQEYGASVYTSPCPGYYGNYADTDELFPSPTGSNSSARGFIADVDIDTATIINCYGPIFCDNKSYGTPASLGNTNLSCTPCDTTGLAGTIVGQNFSQSDCSIKSGTTGTDATGSYTITSDCYY